jgi:hypothetical protein
MSWTARPTLRAGRGTRGAEWEAILDQIDLLTAPGWTDYSSSLTVTASVTNPTKGNSTYTSAYRRTTDADWVIFRGRIIIGSTWVVGSGSYRLSLPVTAHTDAVANTIGSAYVFDTGTANLLASVNILSTTTAELHLNNSLAALGSGGPGTAWATNDEIRWTLVYQAA